MQVEKLLVSINALKPGASVYDIRLKVPINHFDQVLQIHPSNGGPYLKIRNEEKGIQMVQRTIPF